MVAEKLPSVLAGIRSNGTPDSCELLDQAVCEVNHILMTAAADKPEWHGMSTTLVAAWCRSGKINIVNVGDSRAYLIREQNIEQLSEDHTVLAEQQRLGLAEEEQSSGMAHVLTRCIGLDAEVEVCVGSIPGCRGTMNSGPTVTIDEMLAHAGWLRSLALALCRDEASAEDLVQKTWVSALSSPPREKRAIRAWLRHCTTADC